MSPTFDSLGIGQLSVAQRILLVEEIWDSIADDVANRPLPEGFLAEIDRMQSAMPHYTT